MPVEMQAEPEHFYEKVQKLGEKFLAQNPHPKGKRAWRGKEYWRRIIPDLYDAYEGICAYTCHWTPYDTGWKTVEHFKPISKYPQYAYRWDNYRFVCGSLNGRKRDAEEILDPFTLKEGMFTLHFPTLQLTPSDNLPEYERRLVYKTIHSSLKLNDATCIKGRRDWLVPYLRGEYSLSYLGRKAPFLAFELKRQQLDDINHPMWEEYKK